MESDGRQRTLSPERLAPLETWLSAQMSATRVDVTELDLLSGGAVQENWRLAVAVADGPYAGDQSLVLRTDAAAVISMSLDRASEFAVLQAVWSAGVAAAEPIARCTDASVVGAPFLVQKFVAGTAQARKITRDPGLDAWGTELAGELAAMLARIHTINPGNADLAVLPVPIGNPAQQEIAKCRDALDGASQARPALEYVLCWLERHAPDSPSQLVLVHGDYRTGNYLAQDGRLAAILDWEFAHWGDADEDIGWFCAQCWRFGNVDREAGGIAAREAFVSTYEAAAGRKTCRQRIRYWEILAAAKWATIALLQGDRFRKGGEMSVELALTGLMVSELELEAMDGINVYEASAGS